MRTWVVAGVLVAAASGAWAGTVPVDERFTLERQGDGFVRLDRASGAISLCAIDPAAGLVCRLGADERAAYEAKVAALADELARTKDTLQALRDNPADAQGTGTAKPKGFFELLLARMIHIARHGDDPKAAPDSGRN